MKNYRARDVATLIRFGHLTKPSRRLRSTASAAGHVRTVEISITFRSNPLQRKKKGNKNVKSRRQKCEKSKGVFHKERKVFFNN